MGNSSSAPPPPPSPEEINRQFQNTFDPQKNGVAEQFDLNNSNGFMGKTKDTFDEAFKKDGVGNQILRKAGEIGHQIGDAYDLGGNIALAGGTALDLAGMPEFGVPLQAIGGALKVAAPIVHKGSSMAEKTASVIEKPKKDFNPVKDINNIIFH